MATYEFINFLLRIWPIAHLQLNRPERGTAIKRQFVSWEEHVCKPKVIDVNVIVLLCNGPECCSGLTLREHKAREPFQVVKNIPKCGHRVIWPHSWIGHSCLAAMHGAVIGGGLELGDLRLMFESRKTALFYRCLKVKHGILLVVALQFNVSKCDVLVRMTEMIVNGCVMWRQRRARIGLGYYVVGTGDALAKAFEMLKHCKKNSKYSKLGNDHRGEPYQQICRHKKVCTTESLICGIHANQWRSESRIDAFLNRKKNPRYFLCF